MSSMEKAKEVLSLYYGFNDFRENQKSVIENLIAGRDVLAVMPTGGGKSICYQVPALMRDGVCVVISPIISLMYDQVTALRKKGIKASFINSTMDSYEQREVMQAMMNSEIKFIYIAPERLSSYEFTEALKKTNISLIAIDEAHCISQWGHEFRPEYANIKLRLATIEHSINKKNKKIQKIALTATATPEVREEIVQLSGLHSPEVIIKGFDRANLSFHVHHPSSKRDKLIELVSKPNSGVSIVYCSSRKKVDDCVKYLNGHGLKATQYHAGLSKERRQKVQDDFINGEYQVLVATNAFGMGVDIPNVRLVIHYDMPDSMEAYYQEAGRAGRDEKEAECHLMYSPYDRRLHEFLMDSSLPPKNVIMSFKGLIDNWGGEVFNLSPETLQVAIPSLKKSMIQSLYDILGNEGVIERTRLVEGDEVVDVAEIKERHKNIADKLENIKQRRIAKMRLLEVMERYCEGVSCLRNFMLNYFGEIKKEPCGRCSSCIKHYVSLENKSNYTKQAQSCLQTIANSSYKMKKDTLFKIMYGVSDISTLSAKAYTIKEFGELSYMGESKTREFIDFLIEEQYIIYNGDVDEFLYMSNKGSKVLRGEREIYIEKGIFKTKGEKKAKNKTILIKELQEELAKEYHVSGFMIWTHITAKDLIEKEPKTMDDLVNIKGLNKKKIDLFGNKILELFNKE